MKDEIVVNGVKEELNYPSNEAEAEKGYVYELDQTGAGPVNQWEIMKHIRVDDYETQGAKEKRLKIESIIAASAERVAREAKLGKRASGRQLGTTCSPTMSWTRRSPPRAAMLTPQNSPEAVISRTEFRI